jgi:hypothetical protein
VIVGMVVYGIMLCILKESFVMSVIKKIKNRRA